MSRRSAASLAVPAAALVPGKRPDPPDNLSSEEAKVWNGVVGSMPPDWFTPEMWPLLSVLCSCTVQFDKIREALNVEEIGSSQYKSLTRLQVTYATQVMRISTKLKLTAQSRHNSNKAAKATKEAVSLRRQNRPWKRPDDLKVRELSS